VNESTSLSDIEAGQIAEALEFQATRQFNQAWHRNANVYFLPGGANAKIPGGGIVLHLLDTSDQQGALGYHDEDGNEVPYARIFVQTAESDGTSACEVASHEMMELAVDPNCNTAALTGDGSRLYALEVADAVQGNGYQLPLASKLTVADFVLPSYFDPSTSATEKTDFRGAIEGPFSISPQGYYSYIDTANFGAGWQQGFGSERSELPPWAQRHAQRVQKFAQATS
jgi:hypothetical protein